MVNLNLNILTSNVFFNQNIYLIESNLKNKYYLHILCFIFTHYQMPPLCVTCISSSRVLIQSRIMC